MPLSPVCQRVCHKIRPGPGARSHRYPQSSVSVVRPGRLCWYCERPVLESELQIHTYEGEPRWEGWRACQLQLGTLRASSYQPTSVGILSVLRRDPLIQCSSVNQDPLLCAPEMALDIFAVNFSLVPGHTIRP
eukprot:9474346-Pyramimonas_sp.AAC.1